MHAIALPNLLIHVKGELAALSAAFLWAISSVIYARIGQRVPPLELNLSKGIIAIAYLAIALLLQNSAVPAFDPTATALLLLSGIIGIGIADTALFAAYNFLGARRTLLLKILTSPTVALIALIFLQEKLSLGAWCGILLTLLGIAWVISERVGDSTISDKSLLPGVGWAMISTLGDACGAVLSRAALVQTTIDPLWSTFLRLCAGVFILLLWMLWQKSHGERIVKLQFLLSKRLLGVIALTAFFSTYIGIWLQQISFKFAEAGIAQTLNATSPLFIIPLAVWMGEKVSIRATLGVLFALAGVAMLFSLR